MIKRYCDSCDAEIPGRRGDRLRGSAALPECKGLIKFEVMTAWVSDPAIAATWNAGDLCSNCIVSAIDKVYGEKHDG